MSAAPSRFQGLRPGTVFGPYEVIRCIGVGGMGSVFEADHRLLQRKVALKVLHAADTPQVNVRERFMREGATLVRLSHPNIVAVYDAGELDGLPYIAMELLEGETLDRLLARERTLEPARVVRLLAPVADGLELAHGKGIVHRDVKPENLFVTRDERGREVVKLVDFGIAKDLRTSSQHNTIIGTPSYMAPEQLLGAKTIDGRADQFALAVVAYEALTGRKPYEAESVLDLAALLDEGAVVPPSARGVMVPPALESALVRALQTPVEARYRTAGEFAFALLGSITDRTLPAPARMPEATPTGPLDAPAKTPTDATGRRTSATPTAPMRLDVAAATERSSTLRTTHRLDGLRGSLRSPILRASLAAMALLVGALALRAFIAHRAEVGPSTPAPISTPRLVDGPALTPEAAAVDTAGTVPSSPRAGAAEPTAETDVTPRAAERVRSPRRTTPAPSNASTSASPSTPTLRLER